MRGHALRVSPAISGGTQKEGGTTQPDGAIVRDQAACLRATVHGVGGGTGQGWRGKRGGRGRRGKRGGRGRRGRWVGRDRRRKRIGGRGWEEGRFKGSKGRGWEWDGEDERVEKRRKKAGVERGGKEGIWEEWRG